MDGACPYTYLCPQAGCALVPTRLMGPSHVDQVKSRPDWPPEGCAGQLVSPRMGLAQSAGRKASAQAWSRPNPAGERGGQNTGAGSPGGVPRNAARYVSGVRARRQPS